MNRLKKQLLTYCLVFICTWVVGQTSYKMQNLTVNDCRGIFTDSDANIIKAGDYGHNENLTFVICVKGASKIVMTFSNINTELNADSIIIYKGSGSTKTQIASYSGIFSSRTITSNDSCMTIRFVSDASLSNTGWNATWESKITNVKQPNFTPLTNPTCNSTFIDVTLDQKFICDSISSANFRLEGPLAPSISSVSALNCDVSNRADRFRINFGAGLIRSGTYLLPFRTTFKDPCDSIWMLQDTLIFRVTDCPIVVTLTLDNTPICRGTCTRVRAQVIGGDSTKYVYSWTPSSLTGRGPHLICPTINTEYKLTVTDGLSVPGRDSITLIVVDPPVTQNDTTVCISSLPFNLSATPVGGTWSGLGITNAALGTFSPSAAGGGVKTITYIISGCNRTMRVTVRSVTTGGATAACPGSGNVQLTGNSPAGGVWSGSNVTTGGLYTVPIMPGTYIVTYTWNGCSANKTINVDNITITNKPDSFCSNADSFNIKFGPIGGLWSGTGITNAYLGTFKPRVAGAGKHALRYTINGCALDTYIYVKQIDARWDELFCPSQNVVTFPQGLPAGGLWSGNGITNTNSGQWDLNYTFGHPTWGYNDTAWYSKAGCTDFKIIYVRPTAILIDSINRCVETNTFFLDWGTVQVTPWGGTWSGKGVQSDGRFTASTAGYGLHKYFYIVNGCVDSLLINIYQKSIIQRDTILCVTEPAFILAKGQSGGTWSGSGVVNAVSGLFNPSVAGVGNHVIRYFSVNGCKDSLSIRVNPKPTVRISGLDPNYCFRDTNINLIVNPIGGVFTGTVLNPSNQFNPQLAGSGLAKIKYTFGPPQCQSSDSITTVVGDTLKLTIFQQKDTICKGQGINLVPTAKGGTTIYYYDWDNGRNNNKDIYEAPIVSTKYILRVTDYCSNPAIDTAEIAIYTEITGVINTSTPQCFGQNGWAKVVASPNSDEYRYTWNTNPTSNKDSIYQTVGLRYRVNVTNSKTGCFWDGDIVIPGYPRVKADVSSLPRFPSCISNLSPDLYLLDFSEGGISGTWDFGDGVKLPYIAGQNPTHRYVPDTNRFNIKLVIVNEGGCKDSILLPVCLVDTVLIFVPNAFSPFKKDGINDIFAPSVSGTTEYSLEIFNRWGQKLFVTKDPLKAWDGKVNDQLVSTDYYHYIIRYKGKRTSRKIITGVVFLVQ